jgi:hypothetical protein
LSGTPEPLHHTEIRWAPPDELGELDFLPADEELIRRLAAKK